MLNILQNLIFAKGKHIYRNASIAPYILMGITERALHMFIVPQSF